MSLNTRTGKTLLFHDAGYPQAVTEALLWDMLLDKTPHKPNLIQETGIMLVRDLDGPPIIRKKRA